MIRYCVLMEGKEVGRIIPYRGLRQGYPLSPYLFILWAEGLSSLLRSKKEVGAIHGCRIARSAASVSHFYFANDCYLFFRARGKESKVI